MSRFWSPFVKDLVPYVPGEQPKLARLVKLNTNENPYGPSPKALEAMRGELNDNLRLYPDPNGDRLKQAVAEYYGVTPAQVFVGNGSDEVLAHIFHGLFQHDAPLLFPDISYSFYPVYCGLYGIPFETIELDESSLFRIDRFPGYDLYEGGARLTAGARATLRWSEGRKASLFIGRSYRADEEPAFLTPVPDLPAQLYDPTGLSADTSDWVVQGSFSPSDRIRGWGHATIERQRRDCIGCCHARKANAWAPLDEVFRDGCH